MSKKIQAIRLSDKRKQKDRSWLVVAIILATVFALLSVMRTLDSDVAAATAGTVEMDLSCESSKMHPLYAYAVGATIQEGIDAAVEGSVDTCNP